MDVDQGYVSSLEAGKRNPTILTVWHASEALGVLPEVLFRMGGAPSGPMTTGEDD